MQPPTQGFSSSSPELEAMKSAHHTAISSNEKIFPIFARKFASSDTKDFISTARKLTVWLGSEKAYYPVARPKIVELLEIALSAFMDTFVHHSAVAELAEHLRQLVQAIIPFLNMFPETELQSRLQRLITDTELSLSRVSTSTTHSNVLPQGSATANIPSPALTSPIHPQPAMPPVPGPQKSMSQIRPPSSVSGAVKAVPDVSAHVDAPRARNPSEVASGQTDANPSLASPVTNTPQELGENISSSIPSKPQPKRARRAELSEALIARDLDWFKSNQALGTVNEILGASSSKAGESSPALASDTANIPGRPPSPKKKTARMVPSRRLPRRISLDTAQEVKSGVSASALPPDSGPSAEEARSFANVEVVSVRNVNEQKSSMERTESDARSTAVPEAHDMQEDSRHEELPSPEPQLASWNESPIKPEIPQTDHRSSSVKAPLLNGESAIPARPPTLLPDATVDRMESMDISTSDSGSDHLVSEPELTPQSPLMLQLRSPILPPLVKSWEPPLNLNFRISQISPGEPQQSGVEVNQRRFDDEMSVIHSTQGKTFTHTHVIDISLNESIFAKISKWVRRKYHPSEAPHGVCISLACYRFPEFFDTIKSESDKHDIEELTSQSSCSWPHPNRLSLHVNDETRQTVITLSPPLFLTPDQCVDISSLMKPGNNTLEIRQQGDLSEYLVVLHAHHPTRAQLAELDVVKTVDERWKRFLDALSAQAVPGKMLSTAPAGVVGVF